MKEPIEIDALLDTLDDNPPIKASKSFLQNLEHKALLFAEKRVSFSMKQIALIILFIITAIVLSYLALQATDKSATVETQESEYLVIPLKTAQYE